MSLNTINQTRIIHFPPIKINNICGIFLIIISKVVPYVGRNVNHSFYFHYLILVIFSTFLISMGQQFYLCQLNSSPHNRYFYNIEYFDILNVMNLSKPLIENLTLPIKETRPRVVCNYQTVCRFVKIYSCRSYQFIITTKNCSAFSTIWF